MSIIKRGLTSFLSASHYRVVSLIHFDFLIISLAVI